MGLGLAASLHRAATLAAHLEQHPDLEFLGDKPVSNPASQPLVHPENWSVHRVDIDNTLAWKTAYA